MVGKSTDERYFFSMKMKTNHEQKITLILLTVVTLCVILFSSLGLADESLVAKPKYSILQGHTTQTQTQVSIVLPSSDRPTYLLTDSSDGSMHLPSRENRFSHAGSDFVVDQVQFNDLRLGANYLLQVSTGESRSLRTLDLSERVIPKIAVISCASDFFQEKQKIMWAQVEKVRPDLMFFIGDNVYASILDPVSPDTLWKRYVETRNSLDIYFQQNLIPTLAVWDDHDFGQNDGNSSYPYKAEAKEVFESFFAQQADGETLTQGPGVASVFRGYGFQFFFMDDRTFRSAPKTNPDSFWGDEQEAWLSHELDAFSLPTFVIDGSQFFGAPNAKSESFYKDYKKSFERFVVTMKKFDRPFALISGDVHYSDISKIPSQIFGFETIEITSSSIHSIRNPFGGLPKNPNRLDGIFDDNFVVFEPSVSSQAGFVLKYTGYVGNETPIFSRTVSVERQ